MISNNRWRDLIIVVLALMVITPYAFGQITGSIEAPVIKRVEVAYPKTPSDYYTFTIYGSRFLGKGAVDLSGINFDIIDSWESIKIVGRLSSGIAPGAYLLTVSSKRIPPLPDGIASFPVTIVSQELNDWKVGFKKAYYFTVKVSEDTKSVIFNDPDIKLWRWECDELRYSSDEGNYLLKPKMNTSVCVIDFFSEKKAQELAPDVTKPPACFISNASYPYLKRPNENRTLYPGQPAPVIFVQPTPKKYPHWDNWNPPYGPDHFMFTIAYSQAPADCKVNYTQAGMFINKEGIPWEGNQNEPKSNLTSWPCHGFSRFDVLCVQ